MVVKLITENADMLSSESAKGYILRSNDKGNTTKSNRPTTIFLCPFVETRIM